MNAEHVFGQLSFDEDLDARAEVGHKELNKHQHSLSSSSSSNWTSVSDSVSSLSQSRNDSKRAINGGDGALVGNWQSTSPRIAQVFRAYAPSPLVAALVLQTPPVLKPQDAQSSCQTMEKCHDDLSKLALPRSNSESTSTNGGATVAPLLADDNIEQSRPQQPLETEAINIELTKGESCSVSLPPTIHEHAAEMVTEKKTHLCLPH